MGDHNRDEESKKLVWFAFFKAWKKLSWMGDQI
jgi:hypothetical protein